MTKREKEMFIREFMPWINEKPVAKHLNDCKTINQHYNECLVLENGQVIELKGSHEQTAQKYFGDKWEDIDKRHYSLFYWIDKYKVIFIHSHDYVSGPRIMSNLQRQTLCMFNHRGYLSDDHFYNAGQPQETREETLEYDYK